MDTCEQNLEKETVRLLGHAHTTAPGSVRDCVSVEQGGETYSEVPENHSPSPTQCRLTLVHVSWGHSLLPPDTLPSFYF